MPSEDPFADHIHVAPAGSTESVALQSSTPNTTLGSTCLAPTVDLLSQIHLIIFCVIHHQNGWSLTLVYILVWNWTDFATHILVPGLPGGP
jgi:hypothetical protein